MCGYRLVMFFMMWVDRIIIVCLLIFVSRLRKWLCFFGLRLVVGLLMIISCGVLISVWVMLKCWCMLLENVLSLCLCMFYKFIWCSSVCISLCCLLCMVMFLSIVKWLSIVLVDIFG